MADFLNNLSTYPILRIKPDWVDGIEAEFELAQKVNNYAGTIDEVVTYSDERPFGCDLPFKLMSKADEYEFIEFFIQQKGRWARFWLPAPHDFFEMAEDGVEDDTFIIVKDRIFRDAHRGFERLLIEMKNGDLLTFKIISVLPGPLGGQETLNLSTALDRDIPIEDVLKCTFIYLGRFDGDRIELEYYTDRVSSSGQKFVELVKEYP